jgi:hypothetical protein
MLKKTARHLRTMEKRDKRRDGPIGEQNDHIQPLGPSHHLSLCALQPLQRATHRAPATATHQQTFIPHQLTDGIKSLFIGCLYPSIHIWGIARENLWDKVVSDALDGVGIAFVGCVQALWHGEDAPLLQKDGLKTEEWHWRVTCWIYGNNGTVPVMLFLDRA